MKDKTREIGLRTATLLVVASMIGTGVFTTTGFLWERTPSAPWILGAWAVGGLLALCGALNYAELTTALPRNGGEYQLLSRIYHPAVGFVCGWAAFIAGFAAPVGGTAMAFGSYLENIFPSIDPKASSTALILIVATIHGLRTQGGHRFQDAFTLGKAALIITFIVWGLWSICTTESSSLPPPAAPEGLQIGALATGLIFVSYSYLGWNAACYVAGELKSPNRNIPRALILGTAIVMALYLLLNAVFVFAPNPAEFSGQLDIADIVARQLWGPTAALWLNSIIALGLISTVGALTVTGPRIYEAMGEDYPKLAFLSYRPRGGGPVVGIALQTAVALITIFTATYDTVLIYVGITLSLFGVLTVLGIARLRRKEPDLEIPYRAWGHPVTGLIYAVLMVAMIVFSIAEEPSASIAAGLTLGVGALIYLIVQQTPKSE